MFDLSLQSLHRLVMLMVCALALAPVADARQQKKVTASKPSSKAAHVAKTAKATQGVKAVARRGATAKPAKGLTYKSRSGQKIAYKRVRDSRGRWVRVALLPPPPPKPSLGQLAGLHRTDDPLELKSSVAFVMDDATSEVLVSKNADAVLPIASITKLMTAMVVLDAQQDLNEVIEINDAEIDREKGTSSRLQVGTRLSRAEMLHLALMSSENRAAHALGRHYPGSEAAFVKAMNIKATMLGMQDTHFTEPTGLSNRNRSSARDLARLVKAANTYPLIRRYSTDSDGLEIASASGRNLRFGNTNRLVASPDWQISLQKTGFISEAGACLVMQTYINGRAMIMVFLDSVGKLSRFGDASRIRKWIEDSRTSAAAVAPAVFTAPAAPAASVSPASILRASNAQPAVEPAVFNVPAATTLTTPTPQTVQPMQAAPSAASNLAPPAVLAPAAPATPPATSEPARVPAREPTTPTAPTAPTVLKIVS
jgi:D-alanyl-D-alanine endopeptidase (penicillin-binding protein 7)